MQNFENIEMSFLNYLLTKQENVMNRLEKYENTKSNATVIELTKTLSKTLLLLDDTITEPKIPNILVPDCEEPANDPDSEDEEGTEASTSLSINTPASFGIEGYSRVSLHW